MSIFIEIALTLALESLLNALIIPDLSEILEEIGWKKSDKKEVEIWRTKSNDLYGVLKDAEQKKSTNPEIAEWLETLEHLAYDVQDIIEELNYYIENIQSKKKVNKKYQEIDTKLKSITNKFSYIQERKELLGLLRNDLSVYSYSKQRDRAPSVPIVSNVFGRDTDKEEIVELLKEDNQEVGVISIVGMGGLGKTTLTQCVYTSNEVQALFHVRSWVCVSKDFDLFRIFKSILEDVTSKFCDVQHPTLIQCSLHETLKGKKFLIVLDDVWNAGYIEWDTLQTTVSSAAPGSKIIVTTRMSKIAYRVSTIKQFKTLNCLGEEDCWTLFKRHAGLDQSMSSKLEEMGRKIARKCSGLPLTAVIMGGYLRRQCEKEWKHVVERKSWEVEDGNSEIRSVLKLSYDDLPSQVKRCFGFCSLFSGGYEFEEDEIVMIWIGAGLVQSEKGRHVEEVGRDYFQQLVSRSMFMRTKEMKFVLHDVFADFATEIAGKTCCMFQEGDISEKVKHIAFPKSHINDRNFSNLQLSQKVRTILFLGQEAISFSIDHLFSQIKYLRVLSLHNYEKELPKSIAELILMKSIDLSGSKFTSLPDETKLLCNLEILVLNNCTNLEKLPSGIGELKKMWCLDVTNCCRLDELPPGIEKLEKLRKLTKFILGESGGLKLNALGTLKLLRGVLSISKLEHARNEDAALTGLTNIRLEELRFEWSPSQRSVQSDQRIIEHLKPHHDLKKLSIKFYRGTSFPTWLMGGSAISPFIHLSVLKLSACNAATSFHLLHTMESLGELEITECSKMKVKLPEIPELVKLIINGCEEVDCTEKFSLDSVGDLKLQKISTTSHIFRRKITNGLSFVRSLNVGSGIQSQTSPGWTLSSFSLIDDSSRKEMSLNKIVVSNEISIDQLPAWICQCQELVSLEIRGCHSLTSLFVDKCFPPKLLTMEILQCGILKSIQFPMGLRSMEIDDCPTLTTIAGMESARGMAKFDVRNCLALDSSYYEQFRRCCL